MVLQKRLDYGFNGYQVPPMPRASRSARGRRSFGKKVEGNQMCAFDLLATVAGNLLLEKESSPTLALKQENLDEVKPVKQEPFDQLSCDESTFNSRVSLQRHGQNCSLMEYSHAHDDVTVGCASTSKSSGSVNILSAQEPMIGKDLEFGSFPGMIHEKCQVENGSPGSAESCDDKEEGEMRQQLENVEKRRSVVNGTGQDMCSSVEQMEFDTKPPPLVSSDSSVEVPLYGNHIPCGSFTRHQDHVKVNRDDDENSSGCTQPSTITLKSYRPPCTGDRRLKKQLASKHWKVVPNSLRDGDLSNTDSDLKPVSRSRKACYTRQRTQRCNPFKRRRLFEPSSISMSDCGISGDGMCNSAEKVINGEVTDSGPNMLRVCGASFPVTGQKPSLENDDLHVRLNIKSFKIPELFIEIPETATVGSLKRTVMESITAVLGGGLCVGVLLQGKKVRDDNKTLLQAGISNDNKLDSLGFILEPNPSHSPPPLCQESSRSPASHATLPTLTRYPHVPPSNPGTSTDPCPDPPLTHSGNCIESDRDSVPTPTDPLLEKAAPYSRALVPIPDTNADALAVVPLHKKSRRSEIVQRRIRRPFSVSEVEALVQAVEKLGTGRWRDVKLRAFENAKHRTYVDLKDKWKTLVHTARISPQQRRGEPVPQELLDRVLSAHAYWSQQQAKEQLKQQQQSEACLLLGNRRALALVYADDGIRVTLTELSHLSISGRTSVFFRFNKRARIQTQCARLFSAVGCSGFNRNLLFKHRVKG
ncbi:hypothetical protein ACLOJK_012807 [Asimina triloba]